MKFSLPVVVVILVVVVLAVYGAFYVYATNNIQPDDLKTFQEDLKTIESTQIPESQINAISQYADQIENGTSIKELSEEQRNTYSNAMKPNETVKAEFEELNTQIDTNQAIATRYAILLKGDIANEIRTAYNTKLVDVRQNMIETQEKAAEDFAAGNNTAVAADLRQYVQYSKEYNKLLTEAKTSLEKLVNQLKT